MKTKRSKSIWTQAFPEQVRAINPERSIAGGIKARSGSMEQRAGVYVAIADLWKRQNPQCVRCHKSADDVHHKRGRDGLLLFDVRNFVSVCRGCHEWIGANPEAAARSGWLEKR